MTSSPMARLRARRRVAGGESRDLAPRPPTAGRRFLVAMHNLLIDVFVETGTLTCPDSGREFQIVNGIPNMIVPEDQVK